jgi:hypothetical protein
MSNLPTPTDTVIMTLSLDQNRQLKLSTIPPEVTGIQLQAWEYLGAIETARQLILNHYFSKAPGVHHDVDRNTTSN